MQEMNNYTDMMYTLLNTIVYTCRAIMPSLCAYAVSIIFLYAHAVVRPVHVSMFAAYALIMRISKTRTERGRPGTEAMHAVSESNQRAPRLRRK